MRKFGGVVIVLALASVQAVVHAGQGAPPLIAPDCATDAAAVAAAEVIFSFSR